MWIGLYDYDEVLLGVSVTPSNNYQVESTAGGQGIEEREGLATRGRSDRRIVGAVT